MTTFADHLKQSLATRLHRHHVVVWYDEARAFEPFVSTLQTLHTRVPAAVPQPVRFGHVDAQLLVGQGSFFELRFAAEPLVSKERPDPLVLYIPQARPDRTLSVLYELEVGGGADDGAWCPDIKREARAFFRTLGRPDSAIDEMLKAESLTWDDVNDLVGDHGEDKYPRLRVLFPGATDLQILASWIASDTQDLAMKKKGADDELVTLVATSIGFHVGDMALPELRSRVLRGVLVGEFVSDLNGTTPDKLVTVPQPSTPEQVKAARAVAADLRQHHATAYERLANEAEEQLGLAGLAFDPSALGHIDTFRFEERALLTAAWRHVRDGQHDKALALVEGRTRSFWVDRDPQRQMKWKACELMAQLVKAIGDGRASLDATPAHAKAWVDTYARADGWSHIDRLHRHLEFWMTKYMHDHEEEQAFEVVRQKNEEWLQQSAEKFTALFEKANFDIEGVLHQTDIYPTVVAPKKGRTAYLLVDALRYEMGVELQERLRQDARDMVLKPAIAAIPTITPVCMSALLPEAHASFQVIPGKKGELGVRIDGTDIHVLKDRQKFFEARRPELKDVTLDKVLNETRKNLEKNFGTAPFLVVRSTEIDSTGEKDGGSFARQVMETVIGNLDLAIRKLAAVGFEHFVIVADHGHQFTREKDESQRTPSPGGNEIDLHRRCWAGHGGQTPPGCLRVTAGQLGYDGDMEFVFPRGIGVFKAGGGLDFHHGALSLQELVIPVLTLRMEAPKATGQGGVRVHVQNAPPAITNRLFSAELTLDLGGLFDAGPREVRTYIESEGRQVGVICITEVPHDTARSVCLLDPGKATKVTFMLQDDSEKVKKAKVVVRDPTTDMTLGETKTVDVKLLS
jgi:hypothetical protein